MPNKALQATHNPRAGDLQRYISKKDILHV